MVLQSLNQKTVSPQVSVLNNVPEGDFSLPTGVYFLLKNITDEDITLEVKTADNKDFVSTKIYPGWNPELVIAVKGAPADSLQYGY